MKSSYEALRRVMKYLGDPDIDDYVKDRLAEEKVKSFLLGFFSSIILCVTMLVLFRLLLN